MAKDTRTRARAAAHSAGSNPYVKRLIEDDELRNSVREAFDAARDAYGRISNGKGPATALFDDKKVHRDLQEAAENLKEAADRIRGKRDGGFGLGKLLLVTVAGAALAMVLSEDLRKAVLDRLFGAEEEFEYTSTTVPSPEAATNSS